MLPDLPIAVLYLDARFRRRLPSERIWAEVYQERFWQDLIHGLHSFPLALLGCAVAVALGSQAWFAAFASLLFHALLDFPIHAQDAHRHFFPFSQFRFISPLSYGPWKSVCALMRETVTTPSASRALQSHQTGSPQELTPICREFMSVFTGTPSSASQMW